MPTWYCIECNTVNDVIAHMDIAQCAVCGELYEWEEVQLEDDEGAWEDELWELAWELDWEEAIYG